MRYILILALLLSKLVSAQTGGLRVQIIDSSNNASMSFVNVVIFKNGEIITDFTTDDNGWTNIESLDTGKYDVLPLMEGYFQDTIKAVLVKSNQIRVINVKMRVNPRSLIIDSIRIVHELPAQTYNTITIKGDTRIAFKRCYMCPDLGRDEKFKPDTGNLTLTLNRFSDSISGWFITAYLKGDTIQSISELIEVLDKDFIVNRNSTVKIRISFKFSQGKLIEADDDNPGASYSYYFHNDSLVGKRELVDDLGWYGLGVSDALKYSKEDVNIIRNSEVFIKRRK